MKNFLTLITIALLHTSSFSFDYDLTSICSRPGTSELYVGGEFQTLLVLNKENGAELRRLALDFIALDLQFSQDGKTLIVASQKKVYLLNPETGAVNYELKVSDGRLFANSPYFLDVDWLYTKSVKVYSTADGAPVMTHTPEFSPLDAGFNADFTELIVLGRAMDIKGEKKLIQEKVEEATSYNIYNKAYIAQQSDKKGAGFEVVNMTTKASILKVDLPYQTGKSFGLSISKFGSDYYIAGWDIFLKINKNGQAFPLQTNEATFAYAAGATQNGETIAVAGTKKGFVYNCRSNQFTAFDARSDDEFAYSKDMTDDDVMFILNDDYTISVLDEKGMVTKRMKVSSANSGKYGIYYTNGYSKKEDRDKEASIINTQLKALGMSEISLETGSSDDVVLGLFDSVEAAQNFAEKLKKADLSYKVKVAPAE